MHCDSHRLSRSSSIPDTLTPVAQSLFINPLLFDIASYRSTPTRLEDRPFLSACVLLSRQQLQDVDIIRLSASAHGTQYLILGRNQPSPENAYDVIISDIYVSHSTRADCESTHLRQESKHFRAHEITRAGIAFGPVLIPRSASSVRRHVLRGATAAPHGPDCSPEAERQCLTVAAEDPKHIPQRGATCHVHEARQNL